MDSSPFVSLCDHHHIKRVTDGSSFPSFSGHWSTQHILEHQQERLMMPSNDTGMTCSTTAAMNHSHHGNQMKMQRHTVPIHESYRNNMFIPIQHNGHEEQKNGIDIVPPFIPLQSRCIDTADDTTPIATQCAVGTNGPFGGIPEQYHPHQRLDFITNTATTPATSSLGDVEGESNANLLLPILHDEDVTTISRQCSDGLYKVPIRMKPFHPETNKTQEVQLHNDVGSPFPASPDEIMRMGSVHDGVEIAQSHIPTCTAKGEATLLSSAFVEDVVPDIAQKTTTVETWKTITTTITTTVTTTSLTFHFDDTITSKINNGYETPIQEEG